MEEFVGEEVVPPVRFFRDFVEIDLDWEVGAKLLIEQAHAWLGELATGAALAREPMRAKIGLKAGGILAAKVTVTIASPSRGRDGVTIPLTWVGASSSWLFPRLDGLLGLSKIGTGQSQLWLEGSYRAPFGRPGQLMDQAVMHRVADSTIRGFLDRVANSLIELAERGFGDNQQG